MNKNYLWLSCLVLAGLATTTQPWSRKQTPQPPKEAKTRKTQLKESTDMSQTDTPDPEQKLKLAKRPPIMYYQKQEADK